MSRRQDKLDAMHQNRGTARIRTDMQFGVLYSYGLGELPPMRRVVRKLMAVKRKVWRKHHRRVVAWEWIRLPPKPVGDDIFSQRGYVGLKLYARA